jgi:hypothetical protein
LLGVLNTPSNLGCVAAGCFRQFGREPFGRPS